MNGAYVLVFLLKPMRCMDRCFSLLKRVGYVIVFVHDMSSMLGFWKDRIGVRVRYSSEDWSELEMDNITLAIHRKTDTSPRDTGIVFNVDNIHSVVAELRKRGVEVSEPKDIGVGLESLFKDPEGNLYHLFQASGEA